jgi:hypothetical protein
VRRLLTMISGLLALAITGLAFRIFPVDLSLPVSWLWIPFFAGAIFVNAFGLAAIALMVPWEFASDLLKKHGQLEVLERTGTPAISLSKVAPAGPSLACTRGTEPFGKKIA